jgi:hypothetical protein
MLSIIILLIFLIWAMVMLFVMLSSLVGFVRTRVPFVPTSDSDVKLIVEKLKVSSSNVFYDLGSGDGRVVFLVNKLTGAKGVGFELTWWTHLLAQARLRIIDLRFKRSKGEVEFRNEDFFKTSWNEATVIYGYLYPPLMGRVEEKFLADCKPGTVAVIRDFPFPNLEPSEIITTGNDLPDLRTAEQKHRTPSVKEKLKYLLLSFWRVGRPSRHEIFIYRKIG